MLLLAMPASARTVCDETTDDNRLSAGCDMRYRDVKLTCDDGTVEAGCPVKDGEAKPMPMKQTPNKSLIKDFSPYLYSSAVDSKGAPYSGNLMRGTVGDPTQSVPVIQSRKAKIGENGCLDMLNLPGKATTPEDMAKEIRLKLDNCANQHILQTAVDPFYKQNSTILCPTEDDPSHLCTAEDLCQPLKMVEDPNQEYLVGHYLEIAWKKMLSDPTTRTGAANEPALPMGVTLRSKQTIKPPTPFPNITLKQIAQSPYEEILDPTHPFSPRWDYKYNERDHFSIMTAGYMSKYWDKSQAVYCAGNRGASENKDENQEYKVDVLEFRRDKFEPYMNQRITYNNACYMDKGGLTSNILLGWTSTIPPLPIPNPATAAFIAGSFCFKITELPVYPALGKYERLRCWECFGLDGKVDDDDPSQYPPCTTRYDQPGDRTMDGLPVLPGGLNKMSRKANCGDKKIEPLCKAIRDPFTPINKLKMRYHNPEGDEDKGGGPDTVVLKEGVAEGLSFNDYFKGHMPYPRLWDTGQSIQRTDRTDQDPHDDLGQYTAIVGVGREAAPDPVNEGLEEEDKHKDERCLYGGWGSSVSFSGVTIPKNDPVTSWTELKAYQAYTGRERKVVCLGKYEKTFRYRSPEVQLTSKAGGSVNNLVNNRCEKDANGRATARCQELSYQEAKEAGNPSNSVWSNTQLKSLGLPLNWHGYFSAKETADRYPNFGSTPGKAIHTGLDNVKCGDIILLERGGAGAGEKPGLPKLAQVIELNTPSRISDCTDEDVDKAAPGKCEKQKNCFIQVQESDNGKLPDVCGNTDMVGELKTRYIYKPGYFPADKADVLKSLNNWTKSCVDTRLTMCEMEQWDTLKFYRASEDIREGK